MCFTPSAIALARAVVDDRVVGEPSYAQLLCQYQFDTDYHPWFGKDDRWWTAGLSVHHLGLLQLLFGPPESVYALTGPRRRQPGRDGRRLGPSRAALPVRVCSSMLVSTGTYYGTEEVRHGNEALWVQGPTGLVDWRPEGDVVVSTRSAVRHRTALDPPAHPRILVPARLRAHHGPLPAGTGGGEGAALLGAGQPRRDGRGRGHLPLRRRAPRRSRGGGHGLPLPGGLRPGLHPRLRSLAAAGPRGATSAEAAA